MTKLFNSFRLLGIVGAVAFLTLAGVSTALASSQTGTQNPDVTVSTSLTSNGADPERATAGDTVTETQSVTNNTDRRQTFTLTTSRTYPSGQTYTVSRPVNLAPGETLNYTLTYTVDSSYGTGTYSVTLSAADRNGASTATASLEIY